MHAPTTLQETAQALREAAAAGTRLRPRGGATKLAWGGAGEGVDADLDLRGLDELIAHNAGDFTAILQAGVPLARAEEAFARERQMLALDPWPGDPAAATIGGVLAAADSGPLRHRYGGVRDLVVGMTVALSDGTLAKSGGTVIKNVAGYDLGKLFCGSLGTLGVIVGAALRLHPRPERTATALGASEDPGALAGAVAALARLPLEADCLDVAFGAQGGRVLVRFSGAAAEHQAEAALAHLSGLAGLEVVVDDDGLWEAQRAGQRSAHGAVLKVSALPAELSRVLDAARAHDAAVVGRGALGLSWLVLEGEDLAARVARVRAALAPRACVLLDAPQAVRAEAGAWPPGDPGAVALMRRVKARFDPARILRPGAYVGGV